MELKPCPFCGGTAKLENRDVEPQNDPWYGKNMQLFVLCTGCGACKFDLYFHDGFGSEADAAAAWNGRAPSETPAAKGDAL